MAPDVLLGASKVSIAMLICAVPNTARMKTVNSRRHVTIQVIDVPMGFATIALRLEYKQ